LEAEQEKPPANYRWVDEKDPSKGVTAIAGGPATELPEGAAGRLAMMRSVVSDLPGAKDVLLKNRGEYGLGPADAAKQIAGIGDLGRAQRTVRVAIEAALRAATGAAAPESEVARYLDMYMPGATDSLETAKQKLKLLDAFIANAEQTMTQGRSTQAPGQNDGWRDVGNGVRIREKR
jgi:hypothetical protein